MHDALSRYQFPTDVPAEGLVPLEAILCTEELHSRSKRPADYAAESRALSALVQALAESPRTILQALADTLLTVFDADSAGLSLLAADGNSFYWPAIAGDWKPHIGGGTPRNFGPCGDVLDRNEPLLFRHWELRYPYLLQATPLAEEGLLVPFYVGGTAVGTIWTIAHGGRRKFDAEDLRQLQTIGRFAAVAYETVQLLDAQQAGRAALELKEEANRSRQMFQTVVETTPECIKIVAPDGSLEYMNPAGLQMIEAGSAEQVRGACIFDLIAPEHQDQWRAYHDRVCRGERLNWEFDLVGLNGTRRHMATHAAPLPLPDGTTAQLAVTRDITERKERERRLQERDEQLAMAEEAAGIGIWTIDMATETVRGTPQFWRLMGLPPTEEVRPLETTRAVRPPEEASRIRDAFRNAVASGADSFESEYQIRRPGGEVRWIFGRGHVIRDTEGQPVQYTGIDLDVTERKQRDQQLRDSERHLHDLLEALPAAVYTTDAEGRINFYNEAAVELAGRRPVMGDQWCVTWKLYHPDGRFLPHDQCPMAIALKEGRPVRGAEAVAERPDGTRVPFIPYPTPLHDSSGKLIGAINMLVDISDRKAAELRLREAHERLETVLKTARVGLWEADLSTGGLTVSPTCKANFGLPPEAEFTHETMFAAMHPEDRPLFDQARRRALAGEAPYEVEYRNYWPDRSQHWIFTRATIQRDQDGVPTRISGLSIDITDRRRAEQAWHSSEERLARLLHLTPLGIVEIAPKGKIVYANAAAERILRLTRSDIEARQYDQPDWRVTTPEGEPIPPRSLPPAQALRGRNVVAQEVAVVSGDGDRVVISVNAMPLREPTGGGVSGALVAFSDVTARCVAESALKESEERFRALANNIPQLAWMANSEGWIFWYNQRWYDYTGTTQAEMRGWGWQAVHDPERLPEVLQRWRGALKSGAPFEMTFPLRGADGIFRPFLTRVSPLRNETGRIMRWFGTNTDVTEQQQIAEALRASEERLRQLNESLEARVRDEVAHREQAQRELLQVQKLEAIGQLTGGIAHDFNNLLTAIIGNLEVLKAGPTTEKARRHIEAATQSAERGATLTQQLLAYARKQYLVSRPVDLNQLILNLDELLNRSLGGLVQVELELADDLWYAQSDPTQLELAILNLAINARDAMPFGGSLRIETRNVAPVEQAPADLPVGDYVYLQITDAGEGMTPEVLSKAMDPFFTTKGIGKGSGLGLSQVYGVVKQCGGTIRLESIPGSGTTVRIWLPRTHQVPIETKRSDDNVERIERTANVLVVDDDSDVRSITVEILQSAGYSLQEAESAERALDLLDRGLPVDVALVDYAMPRMSGAKFVNSARERRPDLPVIYITGYAEPLGIAQETNAIVLRKPYRSSDLLHAVKLTVEQQEERTAAANVISIQTPPKAGAA